MITITRVVTRNFLMDIIAKFQNLFGMNLTAYETMVNKGIAQIQKELFGKKLDWYRYEITQLTNGAVLIVLYGEKE